MTDQADRNLLSQDDIDRVLQNVAQAQAHADVYQILWSSNAAGKACITWGLPPCGTKIRNSPDLKRMVWWPNGVCQLRRHAAVSSRLTTNRHTIPWWYDLLRTMVLHVDAAEECVVAVRGTTSCESVVRAATLFEIPCLQLSVTRLPAAQQDQQSWLNSLQAPNPGKADQSPLFWRAYLSPLPPHVPSSPVYGTLPKVPNRDIVQLAAAHRIFVLYCRAQGHLHASLRQLLDTTVPPRPLVLAAEVPPRQLSAQQDLCQAGAVPWLLSGLRSASADIKPAQCAAARHNIDTMTLQEGPLSRPEQWLCHWTRARRGAWPRQPQQDYLDELILGSETTDRSALAALLRIIACSCLQASPLGHGLTAVSFTEVPLTEFRERRVYRRHKRQYDFEPWGIAIRRTALQALGARAVRYTARTAPSQPNLWQQPARDRSRRIDWTLEREWRLPRDLLLHQLPPDACCIFVDSTDALSALRAISRWPAVVVPADTNG